MTRHSLGPVGRVLNLAAVGARTGCAVGAAQWLALRPYRAAPGSWAVRCAAAFGAGLLGRLQGAAGFATSLGVARLIVGILTVRAAERITLELAV